MNALTWEYSDSIGRTQLSEPIRYKEALALLIHVRHHCFVNSELEGDSDFRMAFRKLNRLYVQLRDNAYWVTPKMAGRPPKHANGAERQKAYRKRHRGRFFRKWCGNG